MQRLIRATRQWSQLLGCRCRSNVSFASFTTFDRASHLRKDVSWKEDSRMWQESEYVMFMGLKPVAENIEGSMVDLQLARFRYEEIKHLLVGEENGTLCVFLGVDGTVPLMLLGLKEAKQEMLTNSRFVINSYISVKPFIDRSLLFYARAMLAWNYNHPYCSYCGSQMKSEDLGHKRLCSNASCKSKNTKASGDHAVLHPRSDPATIMSVSQGSNLLLARKDSFPKRFISCVAGFVEPGESLEEAVAREVREEVGLRAASVNYLMSESWPFDSVLMLGCAVTIDENDSTPLTIDSDELSFAAWFPPEEVELLLQLKHPDWMLPPSIMLAYRLVDHWMKNRTM